MGWVSQPGLRSCLWGANRPSLRGPCRVAREIAASDHGRTPLKIDTKSLLKKGELNMHLNHLNLPVTDVAATSTLLQRHFGLKEISGRSRPDFAVLRDDVGLAPGGFTIEALC